MTWPVPGNLCVVCVVKDVPESTLRHSVDAVARMGTLNASRVTP
jgi:hypothetical protein